MVARAEQRWKDNASQQARVAMLGCATNRKEAKEATKRCEQVRNRDPEGMRIDALSPRLTVISDIFIEIAVTAA